LSPICGARGVNAAFDEVPSDLILVVIMNGDLRKLAPKRDVLADMLKGKLHVHFDFGDPPIIGHGLLDIPILPRGNFVNEGGQ
jgi:hypothetical protein